jgi:isocitrate/isopropylmalate dehydrogenase
MPKPNYSIAFLPGDGVGREVIARALEILRAAGEQTQVRDAQKAI